MRKQSPRLEAVTFSVPIDTRNYADACSAAMKYRSAGFGAMVSIRKPLFRQGLSVNIVATVVLAKPMNRLYLSRVLDEIVSSLEGVAFERRQQVLSLSGRIVYGFEPKISVSVYLPKDTTNDD